MYYNRAMTNKKQMKLSTACRKLNLNGTKELIDITGVSRSTLDKMIRNKPDKILTLLTGAAMLKLIDNLAVVKAEFISEKS